MRSGSIASTLKNVCSSIPFSARIGVAISLTVSIVKARPIGEQKWISRLVAQLALAQLGLDEERDLERRRRALVGHAGDRDDDPAAGERVERLAKLERRLGGVEVMGLGVEVLDLLGHDPGAGGEDELVVLEAHPVRELDELARLVHANDLADDERTRVSSRPRSGRCSFSARSPPIAMYMKPGW